MLKISRPFIYKITPIVILFGVFVFTIRQFGISYAQTITQNATLLFDSSSLERIVGQTFELKIGISGVSSPIMGIDTMIGFDSSMLDIISVTNNNSYFSTLVPTANGTVDLTQAVSISSDDPSQSSLTFGLLAFDSITNTPITPSPINLDPATNPLATVTFKAKKTGSTQLSFKYDGNGVTTDSNIVAIINGEVIDTMTQPAQGVQITISSDIPTPSLSPTPSTPHPTSFATPTLTPTPGICIHPYDFDNDGKMTVVDIMRVASIWNTRINDVNFNPAMDTDSNGIITIIDIQKVASTWGEICP